MEPRDARTRANESRIEHLVVFVSLETDSIRPRLTINETHMTAIIHRPVQSRRIYVPRSGRSSLLGLKVSIIILAKLGTNQSILDIFSTECSLPGVEFSDIEGQTFLNCSEIIHSLYKLCFNIPLLEQSESVV